jgi:2-phosphoglycolate phosphatase
MLRAVLFDFDGTLADSYPAITTSINHVRDRYDLPPLPESAVRRFVGRGIDHLLTNTVPVGDWPANAADYRAHYATSMLTGTVLLPGAAETLRVLHECGRKLAVCSNKLSGFTRELLRVLGVAEYITAVLGPEEVAQPKPAPDMLLAALGRLGVSAAEAVYVGDMTVDIEAGRAAGLPVWVVPTGSDTLETLRGARPERILGGLADVPPLLLGP